MELKRIITTKKWLIIYLFVLFLYVGWLIAYFLWGIDYVFLGLSKEPTIENEQLSLQIESSRKELADIPDFLVEREYQLEQAQELLVREQGRIPGELNINDLVRRVIEIAEACQVKVIPLSTTPPGATSIGDYPYSYWSITISVEGDFLHIADFIENIDGRYLSTATVVSTALNQDIENPGSPDTANSTAAVNGKLQLIVYARP